MNLLAYIQGKRKGKEAHRIEREAMQDPFLADALEGYDEVKADHAERITRLRRRLPLTSRRSDRKKLYMGIAASLLLCLTVGGYFLLDKQTDNLIAMNASDVAKEERMMVITEEEIELTATDELPPEHSERPATQGGIRWQEALPPPPAPSQQQAEAAILTIVEDNIEVEAPAGMERIAQLEEDIVVPEADMATVRQTEAEDAVPVAFLREAEAEANKIATASPAARARSDSYTEKPAEPTPQIGMEAYNNYLKAAMIPLKAGDCAQTTGIVEVEFKLKTGKPTDFVITQSFCDAASKEAIRLIENGSPWIGEDNRNVVLKVVFD